MTQTFTDSGALVTWSTPQCPFVIEYSRKALDDIRLAVVDAFFSLPRGGAEIGGVLLGRFEEPRLQILDYAPLECEHAFGPAFTLSPKDLARLSELLAEVPQRYKGLQVVGWYHSHTRSEISLCDADLEVQNRYFPERWQVALVLRPSTLQPTQAGFFFREPDGSIRSQSSYQEFTLETLPARPLPAGAPSAVPGPVHETAPESVVITMPSPQGRADVLPVADTSAVQPAAPPAAPFAPEPLPKPWADAFTTGTEEHPGTLAHGDAFSPDPHQLLAAEEPPHAETGHTPASDLFFHAEEPEASAPQPDHGQATPSWETHRETIAEDHEDSHFTGSSNEAPRPKRRWVGIAAGVFAGIALGVVVDQARSHAAQPQVALPHAAQRSASPAPPVTASVGAADVAVRRQNEQLSQQNAALSAEISSLRKQNADLLKQQAPSGVQQSAIIKQQSDLGKQQAELKQQQAELARQQADWNKQQAASAHQQTTLTQQDAQLRQQRDDLTRQTAKLKADLSAQTARAQSLQQQVEQLRRQAQRRRLSVQSTDQLP